jgi:hypothetical protein
MRASYTTTVRSTFVLVEDLDRGMSVTNDAENVIADLEQDGGPLSSGEILLLRVAFDLWNGGGGAKVGELLATLDGRNLRAVALALLERDGGGVPLLEEARHG